MDRERWLEIPFAPGYFVSDHGRVRSPRRELKLVPTTGNYLCVTLGPYRKWILVHRLVLETFVGPAPKGTECCHANGDPHDNRLPNLRWDSHLANMSDAHRADGTCWVRLSAGGVERIRDLISCGVKQRDIAKWLNVSQPTVSAINVGRIWKPQASAQCRG